MLKHDTEHNWSSKQFIPKCAEVIVYDTDENYNYERIKIGDGTTDVNKLPFIDANHNHDNRYYTENEVDKALRIIDSANGHSIFVSNTAEWQVMGLSIFGRTTQAGTPSPSAPVPLVSIGDGGNIGVKACGKNLLKNTASSGTQNGVTYTVNVDGSIIFNGTATANTWIAINKDMGLQPGDYILSGNTGGSVSTYFMYAAINGNNSNCYNGEVGFTVSEGDANTVYFVVYTGVTFNNHKIYPMVRLASVTDATYEPYKESGTLTINTPNGLPGIPVDSGGNYTDENGQQWICDEIDFGRGVYVQRVKLYQPASFSLSAFETSPYRMVAYVSERLKPLVGMCNIANHSQSSWGTARGFSANVSGQYGAIYINLPDVFTTAEALNTYVAKTPVTFLCAIETPIETPLSTDVLSAYAALKTQYPNTTIMSDCAAYIHVEYATSRVLEIDSVLASSFDSKADSRELISHTDNYSNPHKVSLSQLGLTVTATELNYVDGVTSGIQNQLDQKAAMSKSETIIVPSSSWTGDTAPYTAVVPSSLATTDNILIVGAGGSMTENQYFALFASMIICTGQGSGNITLTAYRAKPTVDIPINLVLVG